MQIVIDIDEKIYEARKNWVNNPKRQITELDFAVANGTPLPKGHGRLIDADKVNKIMNGYILDRNKSHTEKYVMLVAKDIVIIEPTIIEADKAEGV